MFGGVGWGGEVHAQRRIRLLELEIHPVDLDVEDGRDECARGEVDQVRARLESDGRVFDSLQGGDGRVESRHLAHAEAAVDSEVQRQGDRAAPRLALDEARGGRVAAVEIGAGRGRVALDEVARRPHQVAGRRIIAQDVGAIAARGRARSVAEAHARVHTEIENLEANGQRDGTNAATTKKKKEKN